MVSSTMPTASFALIIIDNSTGLSTAPTPRDHEIVVDRVGILLPETSLLHLRQAVGITTVANPYPFFNGTIIVTGVSITTTSASNSPLFNLDNPTVATLMFDGVDSVVGIVSISQGFNQKSVVCGSVHILLDNCDINSTFDSAVVVPLAREIATLDCALALDVQAHNVTFSPRNHRTLVSVSNQPLLLLTISIKLTVRACKIVLQDASYQVLAIVANTTAVNSMIQLINTEIVLQWTPYVESNFNFSSRTVYFTEIAPVSIIQLGSVRNSTVELNSCNVTVVQVSTTSRFVHSPAALLFSVVGLLVESSISIRNSSFVVVRNSSSGSSFELSAPLLNLSGVGAVVSLHDSLFVNIVSIAWRQVILPKNVINTSTTLVNSLTMIDGCGNVWCPDSSSGVISGGIGVGCTRHLSSGAMANLSTPLPAWLSIERCATKTVSPTSSPAATRSWQETASVTSAATSSPKVSLSRTKQRSETAQTSPSLTIPQPINQPAPPVEPPVIVQAAAVAIVAPLAGALLATSVAGVIQRSTIALRFSDCTASELQPSGEIENAISPPPRGEHIAVSENPTRLAFGPAEGAMYRGAAVGNLLIVVGLALVIVPGVNIRNRCKKKSSQVPFSTRMAQLQLPGRAYVVYCVLLQPTITAATGALLLGVSGPDIALAVVVLAALLILAVWPVWRVHEGCQHLVRCEVRPLGSGVVEYFVGRCVTWVPRSTAPAAYDLKPFDEIFVEAANFIKQYSSFIGRVRSGLFCEVFFAFGFLWSMIAGVVGALDPADPKSCQAAQVTLVIVAALSLTSLVAVRPYASPADRNVNITLEGLSLVIAALSLANTGDSGTVEAISYIQLVISAVVSALRAVVSARTWLAKSRGDRKDPVVNQRRFAAARFIISKCEVVDHNVPPRRPQVNEGGDDRIGQLLPSDSTIRVPLRRASQASLRLSPTMRTARMKRINSLIDGEYGSHHNFEHHVEKAAAEMTEEVNRYFAYRPVHVTTLPQSMQDVHLVRLILLVLSSRDGRDKE